MEDWQYISLITLVVTSIFISFWAAASRRESNHIDAHLAKKEPTSPENMAQHIITPEFRESMQHSARQQFEGIIRESAHFIEQDVRISTSQLNEYIKQQVTGLLKEQFQKYSDSILEAEKIALTSLEKSRESIEQQRLMYQKQLMHELQTEKQRIITNFEQRAARIVEQYVTKSLADVMNDQQLEALKNDIIKHKAAIIEDIKDE
jgi:hypothetical protein